MGITPEEVEALFHAKLEPLGLKIDKKANSPLDEDSDEFDDDEDEDDVKYSGRDDSDEDDEEADDEE